MEGNDGGRRGGGPPFRGGGRRGGRGRGRGRGGGRRHNQFAPTIPQIPAPPVPVLKVWCDICRVECNTLEILEQHKNGKRHKKTAQRFEEMQKQQKLVAEYQSNFMPGTMYSSEYQANVLPSTMHTGEYQADIMHSTMHTSGYQQANVMPTTMHASGYQQANVIPSNMHTGSVMANAVDVAEPEKNLPVPENVPTAVVSSTQVVEPTKVSDVEPAKVSETADNNAPVGDASKPCDTETEQNSEAKVTATEGTTKPPNYNNFYPFDPRRGGAKRKMTKYGRGGKKLKKFEPVPRKIPERPRVCTLCNVMCETLIVFNAHIAGKKHVSKLKRFQPHGTVYGPITVYIPPNQPSAFPTNGQEPLFYGLKNYEMVNQVTYNMEGVYLGNHGNQDAPLEFIPKENNCLEIKDDVKVTNTAALESNSKEKNDVTIVDAISVTKDAALESDSKEKNLVMGNAYKVTENAAIDSELKENSIPEMGDALNITEGDAVDSDLKEKNIMEADDDCNVNEVAALNSESEGKNLLDEGHDVNVKEDV